MRYTRSVKNQKVYVPEEWELDYIRQHVATKNNHELAKALGWTYSQVRHIKNQYRVARPKSKKWTEVDLKFLKEKWLYIGNVELGELLGRSTESVGKKLYRMGWKRPDWS